MGSDLKQYDENYIQVGATPEGVEVPRCVVDPSCLEAIEQQLPGHKAIIPTGADPKWRFFWRLGPRPSQTQFVELNAEPVIPEGAHSNTRSLEHNTATVLVGLPGFENLPSLIGILQAFQSGRR